MTIGATSGEEANLDQGLLALEARLTAPGAPFELTARFDGARRFASGPVVLGDVYRRATAMGDKTMVVTKTGRWSYSDVVGRGWALAAALVEEGYQHRRIGLLVEDGPEWLVWFVGITAAGATCVLSPPGTPSNVADRCLAAANCDAVIIERHRWSIGGGLKNLHGLQPRGEIGPTSLVAAEDEALIIFTSGSSGEPKGVVHTHRSLLSGLRNMMLAGTLGSQMAPVVRSTGERPRPPSTLVLAPLAYIGGYSAFLLAMATGGRLVLAAESGGTQAVASAIEAEGVTAISGGSIDFIRRLLRRNDAALALRSLRRLQLHGSALQGALVREIGEALPDVQLITGYGLSETSGSIAGAPVQRVLGQAGGCGRLLASVDLRVVDDAGRSLPPGTVGHIEVRGDMVMKAYLDPARTAQAFTADGWLRCGDMGALDPGNWLRILDRSERRLAGPADGTSFIAEVEEAVRAVSGVDDAAIAASPGHDGIVVYVQTPPEARIDLSALHAVAASAGLSGALQVTRVDALPRTPSGKIDYRRLAS